MYHIITIPKECWIDLKKEINKLHFEIKDIHPRFIEDGNVELYLNKDNKQHLDVLTISIHQFTCGWFLGLKRGLNEGIRVADCLLDEES